MVRTTPTAAAYFGAGCFWGVEEVFRTRPGVAGTRVGYAGGHVDHPTYEQVCAGGTGHIETVEVTYDPNVVTFSDLLKLFFENHDPTQIDKQGPDEGEQYRSVIFVRTRSERESAEMYIEKLQASGKYATHISTRVEDYTHFWLAEEYHQQYLHKRGLGTCHT
ncbi:MAG: peptide-methionine (S)-S-oxide reductase MsrA [Patescibacteria group bacterium]